ncbi:MAG: hypothetical protein Q8O14_00380, partial [bacterium]|nr:hypothetical protein [bacterium]
MNAPHPLRQATVLLTLISLAAGALSLRAKAAPERPTGQDELEAATLLYLQLKQDGGEIPAWLFDQINPPQPAGGARQGGDTQAEAVAIPFSPGGTYTDPGTTAGYANDYDSNVAASFCQMGTFFTSSFGSADVFYTFTLPGMYTVTADICEGGTWDSALGIIDSDGTLVAYNDDGGGCTASLRSRIANCCLPAGTYYIVVDAYSTATGTYTLNVQFGSAPCVMPCDLYTQNILTLNAPGTITGSTVGAPGVYAGAGGDAGIDIAIPHAAEWNFDACVAGTDYAADIYLFTANPCAGGTLIASNTTATCAAAPATTARLLNIGLQAGTYHLLVGHTAAVEGAFAINVFETTPARPFAGDPDAFGYVWRNSLDPNGPDFDWVEISQVGTPVPLASGSSVYGPVDLGMNFPFYESTHSTCYVSSEGFLSFDALASSYLTNATIPSAALPQNIVAGFWDDLSFTAGVGQAYTWWDAANQRFILEYKDFTKTAVLTTFQIILHQNGNILVQYLNTPEIYLNSATVGIEDGAGARGLLVNYNNTGGALWDGIALQITRPVGDVVGPSIIHTPLVSSEDLGPYSIFANISDLEHEVAAANLVYRVNGGTWNTVPMVPDTPPSFTAQIPAQTPPATVNYYLQATDTADPSNTTTTATWTFSVQDYTLPPSGLSATDGVVGGTTVTWSPPAWLLLNGDPGPEPLFEDYLPDHATKDGAWAAWQADHEAWVAAGQVANRAFLGYNVYRGGQLAGTVTGLSFTDNLSNGSQPGVTYSYTVRASFTAGESAPSNSDTGWWSAGQTSGGPDTYGYMWFNSNHDQGPAFNWIDISGVGAQIAAPTDDGFTGPYDLGFAFPFYENSYSTCYIASNGFITFGTGNGTLTNQNLPSPTIPNNLIAGFWDDMAPHYAGASIHYYADTANNRFVVQYHVPGLGGVAPYIYFDFQIVLTPNGAILVQLLNVNEVDISQATIGIENAMGTIGLTYNFDGTGAPITDQMAIRFLPPQGPEITHTPLTSVETELPGPHVVEAEIVSEEGVVASAQVVYSVNGGANQTVAMVHGAGNTWTGDIPHQDAGANVSYRIEATDDQGHTRMTQTWTFQVVSYQWPPLNLSATDGLLLSTLVTWLPPVNPGLLAARFGDELPANQDEGVERLMAQGLSKEEALAEWVALFQEAERVFISYRVYRDGVLAGTTTGTSFIDNLNNGAEAEVVYTYTVRALFTAGESTPSNSDQGSWSAGQTSGGPDSFGYTWMNSGAAGGPVFAWTDISGLGTQIASPTDDGFTGPYALGFPFPFYENSYSECFIASNGFLTFGTGNGTLTNQNLPSPTVPNNLIAGFWDDMAPHYAGASIHYYSDTANNRFIVQYHVPAYGSVAPYVFFDFQIVLTPNGAILVQLANVNEADISQATIGIEDAAGLSGLTYNYNGTGAPIGDELAIRFTYPVGPLIAHTPLPSIEAELPGGYAVNAQITSELGVASAAV